MAGDHSKTKPSLSSTSFKKFPNVLPSILPSLSSKSLMSQTEVNPEMIRLNTLSDADVENLSKSNSLPNVSRIDSNPLKPSQDELSKRFSGFNKSLSKQPVSNYSSPHQAEVDDQITTEKSNVIQDHQLNSGDTKYKLRRSNALLDNEVRNESRASKDQSLLPSMSKSRDMSPKSLTNLENTVNNHSSLTPFARANTTAYVSDTHSFDGVKFDKGWINNFRSQNSSNIN